MAGSLGFELRTFRLPETRRRPNVRCSTNYSFQDGYFFQGDNYCEAYEEGDHGKQGNFDDRVHCGAADCEAEVASLE